MNDTILIPIEWKWLAEILYGDKEEEYREIKQHWVSRLVNERSRRFFKERGSVPVVWDNGIDLVGIKEGKETVTLVAGYGNDKPRAVIEIEHIEIKKPNPKWCPPGTKGNWFSIKLGRVLETSNL